MPVAETIAPPCTIVADVEGSGTCFVPEVFGSDLQHLCASLDWARVFNNSRQDVCTAQELEAAACAARAIADRCDRFAIAARAVKS